MNKTTLIVALLVFSCSIVFAQATPPVRMIAEWEPALGTLIRWPLGIPFELVEELAEDDSLYILVETQSEEQQAISAFSSWNVNLDHCHFIIAETYSHWTRDWGPQCLFDGDGNIGVLDPIFAGYPWVPALSRDWSEDDAVNQAFGLQMNWIVHELPAYLTGGNVMFDGYKTAFSSVQMLDENYPIMNNLEFYQTMEEYAGIENYNIISNFENYGIQHIDCVAKLLDEETLLIKEVDVWHPEYDLIENVVSEFSNFTNCFGRPYKIVRIYCDYYQGTDVAAYTNSLILNKKVLVPFFNIPADAEALETYQNVMPGYEIIGIPFNDWYYYDALHCRTMGIFNPDMIRIEHNPYTGIITSNDDYPISCKIIDYSQEGLVDIEQILYWKTSTNQDWESIELEPSIADSFLAILPHQQEGIEINYYISSESHSGQIATKPVTAPNAYFAFTAQNSASTDEVVVKPDLNLEIFPNPFNPTTTISFSTTVSTEFTELMIYNLKGQKIKQYLILNSQSSIVWEGTDQNNHPISSGIYYVQLISSNQSVTKKCLLMK